LFITLYKLVNSLCIFLAGQTEMKVLVITGESIGEVIFATPVIRALKVQLDDVEVHALVEAESSFLLDENPYIDQIHYPETTFWRTSFKLRREKFDLVVNLRTDLRSKLLSLTIAPKILATNVDYWKQWLMVNFKINHLQNLHVTDRLMQTIQPLGIKSDELGLDYFIPEKDKVPLDWLPEPFQKNFVIFSISAPYATRKLPVDKLIELCDKINRPIILLGTFNDTETGNAIHSFFNRSTSLTWEKGLLELNKRTIVYNACGKFNLNQMASLIKQASAVFTFDNEFIPVASAFRKEIIGLWGSTILLFGRYPYRTRFTVLESNKVMCRPCSSKGFDKCPKGHFRCMRDIPFDFYLS
jgi:ADP-heptose:LPS heptosyltransferase